ncbi:MAG: PKD domain-containing protein [Thermomicrobiales bacterium]
MHVDWENGSEQFPDLGDLPSSDPSDPAAPVSSLNVTGEVTVDGGTTYIAQHHTFTLSAADLVFTNSKLNTQYRYYPDGQTPGEWLSGTNGGMFSLPADALDGVWHIDFRSEDPCHTFAEDDSLAPESIQTFTFVLDTYPEVDVPVVVASPSDEGEEITVTATFSHPGDPNPHTCMLDYGDGTDPQPGVVVETTCTATHTFADDNPANTASDVYNVKVTVTDNDGDPNTNNVDQTVNNVAPTITGIPTNSPVPQGQLATITVNATDPGAAGDPLTYAFDCDDDGTYEVGPQSENSANCALDPEAAFSTIGVQVSDDDLGVTVGSVEIKQTLSMCYSSQTGGITPSATNGPDATCPASSTIVVLPLTNSTTLCINAYTGRPIWKANGQCQTGYRPHIVPDDGPLHYCRSLWTSQMRIPLKPGQCNTNETAGVIPGGVSRSANR